MAERFIIKIGDPSLRQICKPVKEINGSVIKLLDDLNDTIHAGPNRAGLAAPQVGINKRLVAIDCEDGKIELINPEIIKRAGEQIGPEGCLSLPGIVGQVKRAEFVAVKTLNRFGKEIVIEATGFLARCLQHEIDHLDGILFIDRVEPGQLFDAETGDPLNVYELIKLSRKNL